MMDDLERFIKKQEVYYETALDEIKNGYKKSHWIWFIFPQLKELGRSETAIYYGLNGISEAREYYNNKYLREHLIEISEALLKLEYKNIRKIMGYPDNLKLKSCMTLFEIVDPNEKVFKDVLDRYYGGRRDEKTIELVKEVER